MNIEKARELITHRLNSELTEEETRELDEYITAHPEFKEEIDMLEATWNSLDLLARETAAPVMGDELEHALGGEKKELGNRNLGGKEFGIRDSEFGGGWSSSRYWAVAASLLIGLIILYGVGGPKAPINPNPKINEAPSDKGNKHAAAPNSDSLIPNSFFSYVLRVRGLLLVKGDADNRWRLLQRGDPIKKDESIRIPANGDFGAIVQGPDGSTLALRAGTQIRFLGARSWALDEGAVFVSVAKSKDEKKFTIKTKEGEAVALGTQFVLATGVDNFAGKTICEVDEGSVRLGGKVIGKGKFGVLSKEGVQVDAAKSGTRDWLVQTQALLEANESMARLVASAQEAGQRLPLEIHNYEVDVTVVDGVARTFIDMTFFNHTDRRLEGTFFYTVPGGATISEFAMYVGTTRIVGEVLEQQSARQIFEYIRREQRDPAMLEWAGGNLFKMRVYPIEPRSEKRIQLGYTQVLPRRDGKLSYTFPLVSEMLKKNPLRSLSMGVKIMSSSDILDLECPTHRTEIGLAENKSRGTVAFSAKNYTPANDFNVTWGVPDSNEFLVLTNKRRDEAEGYFLAQISPTVFAGDRKPPERLLIVIDGSGSVDPQSFSVAREFAAAAAEMVEGWQFNVALSGFETIFMNEDFQAAKPGDSKRVYKFLDLRVPIGGTDLVKTFEAISAKLPSKGKTHIVYVGDGINTIGKEEGAGLVKAIVEALQDIPAEVSCVSVGSSYDRLVLEGLAGQMGGTFRAVEGVDNVFLAAESILADFSRPVYRDVQVQFEGVTTGGLYPEKPGTVSEGETAIVLGRIVKGGKGKAIITGIAEGQPFKRVYPIELEGSTEQNHFVPRLWATAHMDSLRARMGISGAKADGYLRGQVIATSLNYQIMSPFTAFLCLESEEDYKRFGIVRRMRMVDWKGELEGITNSAPDIVARTKPKKPRPDLKHVRIPVPSIRFVPQEILDEAQGLMQVEKQFRISAQQWGGMGGSGTLYTSSISGLRSMLMPMSGSEPSGIWKGNSRAGNAFSLYHARDLLSAIPDYNGIGLPVIGEGGGGDLFGGEDELKEKNGRESRLDFLGNNALFDIEENEDGEFEVEKAGNGLLATGTEGLRGFSERSELASVDASFADMDFLLEGGKKRASKAQEVYYGPGFADSSDFAFPMRELAQKASGRLSGWYRRGRGGYGYPSQLHPQSYLRRNNIQTVNIDGGKTLKVRRNAAGEVYLQRSLLANPDDLQARLDLALSLASRRRLGAARRVLEPMLDKAKSCALWLEFAWLDHHLGDREQSRASLRKAITIAADVTQKQHCGYELATFGAYTQASEYFLKLAETEKDLSQALAYYGQAQSYANSSPELRANAHQVWEKALKRFPMSHDCLARAANTLQTTKPELALQYIARHEGLLRLSRLDPMPAPLTTAKLNALFQLGRRDEAWKILEEQARTADNHNAVYQALYTAYNRDHRRAYKLVNEILNDEKTYPITGAQVHGAMRFHQSYNSSFETQKRLHELARREDLPTKLRTTIFYALHRHGGRNNKWTEVMLPLLKKVKTEADLTAAISGMQAMISYGYYTVAARFMNAIAESKALNETQQKQIALMRWQILANSGDIEEATRHLEETFKKIKDPQHAYNLLSHAINPLINNNKAELCIKLYVEMFRRFPSYANNRYLYQNLFNQLRNRGQLDLLRKHQEELRTETKTELAKELSPDWEKLVELAKAKQFGEAFKALEKFQETLSEKKAVMTKEMEIVMDSIKQVQSKATKEAKLPEGTQKRLRELHENHVRLLREYNTCIGLMEVAFRLRIRFASNDEKLTAMFLKECNRKSSTEDPRTREWTQAMLLCLALSDKSESYRSKLESLYKAEPQDPIWPRLLLNARFAADNAEGGMELLARLSKQDPYDVRLAYTWYGIQKLAGTEDEIVAARDQYFRALAIMPNVLQQLGYRWQNQKKIELAVAAWLAMQRAPAYANNGWPTYQAASVLQSTEKERAVDLYMKIFKNRNHAASYGQNSLSQLRSMMNDEAMLMHIEKRLPELTEAKEIWTRNCGYILAAYIAQIRKKDLKPHLKNLFKVSEKDLRNVTSSLMYFFVQAKALDQMYEYVVSQLQILPIHQRQNVVQTAVYSLVSNRRDQKARQLIDKFVALARSDEMHLTGYNRSNLLRNIASNLGSYKETRPLATKIYRELIDQQDVITSNNLYQLVQWLINDNRVAEARQLLKKNRSYRADWNLWYAHDRVIQHVGRTQKNYALAAKIAYEAWKKWDGQLQNYGQNVFNRFTEMSWQAMRKGGLSADLKEALRKEILRLGEGHFQGGNSNTYNQGHLWNCVDKLGLVDTLRKMAEAALASDDPQRVYNAARFASYASNYKHKLFDMAERGYRKLLDMNAPQNLKTQTYSQLYALYTNNHFKRWADALELLEPWKNAGNLQKEAYLNNRGYCLYKLRRNKEGREVVLELLKLPNYRRYYWNAQNIATWCREAKDYITEVECLEHGMRWMRYIGQLQPNYVTRFYTAMGNAYRNMGETEKSYEAFLRGMSLLNRNRNDWSYRNLTDNLMKVLKQDAKGNGLDDMVAYYEKNMLNKGGEMPHMRIAFGDAYEKAGKNLKSLQQYSIAADLMPKDTTLRDKVINGFIKEGRQDLAEKEYLSWAKLDPQNIQIYKRLGELYERMDLYRQAMNAFTSMPEARPREAEGHQQFAKILISKNRPEEAVAPYEKAIKYRPTLFSIADEYAKLQASLGAPVTKLQEIFVNGEEACRRAKDVLEDDPLPWLNLARFLKAQERKGEAKTLLKEILNRRWPRFARETRDEARQIQKGL